MLTVILESLGDLCLWQRRAARCIAVQVKGLAFNQLSPNLLASGGAEGDIIIWDVANPRKPTAFPPLKVRLTTQLQRCAARGTTATLQAVPLLRCWT